MKPILNIFFLVLLVNSLHSQWISIGSSLSTEFSINADIAIDTGGNPVVIYTESAANTAYCKKFNGSSWVELVGLSQGYSVEQLLISPINNNYYVSLRDGSNKPACMVYNGSSWSFAGANPLSYQSAFDMQIIFDRNGELHFFYSTYGGDLVLKKLNGNNWDSLNLGSFPSPTAFPSLAFDTMNRPVLFYTNTNNLKANCKRFDGSQWQQVGTADFSTGFAQYNHIVINDNNEIFVAFSDGFYVKSFKLTGTAWTQLGTEGLGLNITYIDDFSFDSNGKIYLSSSNLASEPARCLSYNGSEWIVVAGMPFSDSTATYPNFAFDDSNNIYAIYNDYVNGAVYVKKNAYNIAVRPTEAEQIHVFPNPSSDILNFVLDSESQVIIFDETARVVLQTNLEQGLHSIDISNFIAGRYHLMIYSRNGQTKKRAGLVKL
jgi:hypothetical protein